jgi:hypothetical protein
VAPEWFFEQSVLLNLFTWATLLFEATFGVLVWNRRLRPWVIGTGIAFHLGIDLFLDIGFFSLAIYLAYLAFLPDGVAERLLARVDKRGAAGSAEEVPWALDEPSEAVTAGGVGGRGSAGAPHPGGAGSAGPDPQ